MPAAENFYGAQTQLERVLKNLKIAFVCARKTSRFSVLPNAEQPAPFVSFILAFCCERHEYK